MDYAHIVDDFGAVSGPLGTAPDATAAVQAAINTGKPVYIPPTPLGSGFALSSVSLPGRTKVFADAPYTTTVYQTGAGFAFDVRGSDCDVGGFTLDSMAASGGGSFKARTDLASMELVKIHDIVSYGSRQFISDGNHASNTIVGLELSDMLIRKQRGPVTDLRDAWAYLKLKDIVADYIGGGSPNWWVYQLRDNQGAEFCRVSVTGGTVDTTTANNAGFFFDNCTAVDLYAASADTIGGHGFYLYGRCHAFTMIGCKAALPGGFGIAIGNGGGYSSDIELDGFHAYGRRGLPYAPSGKVGVYAIGCDDIRMNGGLARDWTGAPSQFDSCTNVMKSGFREVA